MADWTFLSINTKEQGAWPVQGKELVIIGDCKYTPQEVEILPGVLVNNPRDLVLWLRCTHPPTFIPKGQVIAQIIPTRGPNNTPVACPVQAITEERPQVDCEFRVGGETINITGLLDTGADVTVVPAQDWPSHWALQDVAGHVQGVGGLQLARQSRSIVQIKGPKGQLANIRPFVLDYKEPLLGRDLMSQWGVKIDIPDPSVEISAASIDERPTKKLNCRQVWSLLGERLMGALEIDYDEEIADLLLQWKLVEWAVFRSTPPSSQAASPVSKQDGELEGGGGGSVIISDPEVLSESELQLLCETDSPPPSLPVSGLACPRATEPRERGGAASSPCLSGTGGGPGGAAPTIV
ncbi:uncharacterized protein LOC131378767 [Hirundo rustica]|uniref:uncharacterized protein LOC131378767 n=1 Tax=Hirundo rustica TaxID=43150 RepID=UPI0026721EC0|nr:uncharacterized protein LOC131378767 [Hirundo rustica]